VFWTVGIWAPGHELQVFGSEYSDCTVTASCLCLSAVTGAPSGGNVMDTATPVRITDSTYLLTVIRRAKPDVSAPLIRNPCEWSASRLGSFTSVEWVLNTHWKEIWLCTEPFWTPWIGERFLLSPSITRQLPSHPASTTYVIYYTLREIEIILLGS
jgi:hypothetical protein